MAILYYPPVHMKLGYLLNLDLCCVICGCLLSLSFILTGERLGNRLKHFQMRIRYICACHFCVPSLRLYIPVYDKPCRLHIKTLIYMVACAL